MNTNVKKNVQYKNVENIQKFSVQQNNDDSRGLLAFLSASAASFIRFNMELIESSASPINEESDFLPFSRFARLSSFRFDIIKSKSDWCRPSSVGRSSSDDWTVPGVSGSFWIFWFELCSSSESSLSEPKTFCFGCSLSLSTIRTLLKT